MSSAAAILYLLVVASQPADPVAASVSGRVVDAVSGRPIPGVVVTPAGAAVVTTATSPLPPRALTNGQGEFVIRGLRAGTVFFTAVKSGFANATYNQRRPGGSGQGIPLEAGQRLTGVEIRMWRHASITGTVLDEAGDPAVGVWVRAYQRTFVAGRKRFAPRGAGVTDDRGVYRIANLTPGDYAVGIPSTQTAVPTEVMDVFFGASGGGSQEQRARVSRELNAIGSSIVPQGSQYAIGVADQTLTLPPGTLMPHQQPKGGLAIYPTVFYPSAPGLGQAAVLRIASGEERGPIDLQVQPTRTSRVSGTVMGPDGPGVNIPVRLLPAGDEDSVESIAVATTITDGSGSFTLPAVPPGQFVIHVLRPPRDPIDLEGGLRVTPGGDVTVGTAVPAARTGPPPPPPVPLDATLYARQAISVGEGDLTGVVVMLAAGARVTGRVEFEGAPEKPAGGTLTAIRINLDPADGSRFSDEGLAFQAGRPDEDGRFRTFGVPPGRYVLRVNPPSGWFLKGAFLGDRDLSDVPFELTAKDLSGVVIAFTDRPSSIAGVVRTGTAADPDAVVLAFPTDTAAWTARGAFPRRMRSVRAEKDGSYRLNALAPGEYHVVAVHEEAFADWQDPALLESLARVARQIRIGDGERRVQDLIPAVIK